MITLIRLVCALPFIYGMYACLWMSGFIGGKAVRLMLLKTFANVGAELKDYIK